MSATTLAPAPVTSAPAERHPLRWAILAIVLVAEVMDLLDGTIVNVAAPPIRRDLGGPASTLPPPAAAYTLAFAVLIASGARLGDLIGRGGVVLVGGPW